MKQDFFYGFLLDKSVLANIVLHSIVFKVVSIYCSIMFIFINIKIMYHVSYVS